MTGITGSSDTWIVSPGYLGLDTKCSRDREINQYLYLWWNRKNYCIICVHAIYVKYLTQNKSDKFVDVWAYQGIYTYVCRKSLKIRLVRDLTPHALSSRRNFKKTLTGRWIGPLFNILNSPLPLLSKADFLICWDNFFYLNSQFLNSKQVGCQCFDIFKMFFKLKSTRHFLHILVV